MNSIRWIIDGYLTLAAEAEEQLGNIIPTHVFLQAGVGAMAGGVLEYLLSCYRNKPPVMTIVEPTEAACIYLSAKCGDGRCHSIDGNPVTIMAGLNCGTPCRVTWPAIRDKATFFCACDDIITEEGMRAYDARLCKPHWQRQSGSSRRIRSCNLRSGQPDSAR